MIIVESGRLEHEGDALIAMISIVNKKYIHDVRHKWYEVRIDIIITQAVLYVV